MDYPINDPYFRVEVLSKTERPNLLCYLAMHQDYSESNVYDEMDKLSQFSESELGERLVRNCIKYNHWGILEHPSITFNVIGFPHNVMVQARTHRVGISFDVQSQRYTGKRIQDLFKLLDHWENNEEYLDDCIPLDKKQEIQEIFYFRPIGVYLDREGNKYNYGTIDRDNDIAELRSAISLYSNRVSNMGYAPEHARDMLPQNIRQDFVVTFNARSLLHFCDLRLPADAQPEIRTLAQMIFEQFEQWLPEVAEWYKKNRYAKNKLSP